MCLIPSIAYVILLLYVGVDGQTVTIVTDPAGVPVDGQNNTFDYPILTSVTLMCIATAADGSPANVTSYHWNAQGQGQVGEDTGTSVNNTVNNTFDNLLAQHAGTLNCTATIDGTDYISDPLTLRISGELNQQFMILSSRNINGLQIESCTYKSLWMDTLHPLHRKCMFSFITH